jgi:hypothetical protein
MKDLWFKEFEKELSSLEAQGLPVERAYELATSRAGSLLQNTIADKADAARLREKEGRK